MPVPVPKIRILTAGLQLLATGFEEAVHIRFFPAARKILRMMRMAKITLRLLRQDLLAERRRPSAERKKPGLVMIDDQEPMGAFSI